MEAFAFYLMKSTVWLSGFALVYALFLRNERFFFLNRIFLVSGMLFSIVFPLFTWHYTVVIPVVPNIEVAEPQFQGTVAVAEASFPTETILMSLYLLGILFLMYRIFNQTLPVFRIIRKSEVNPMNSIKLIRTTEYPASFSFISFVFVNPSIDEIETREIVNHEQEHIRQMHWIDLLLFEIIRTMQWFNPVIWLYGRLIRQNHEYLADEQALQRSSNPAIYRAALLNQMFGGPVIPLVNSFNYSLNKKRFTMMKHTIQSPFRKLKLLTILPFIGGVFFAFSTPEYQFVKTEINSTIQEEKTVTGKVISEDGKPLKGASIVVSGKSIGTSSDASGNFTLKLSDDSPIVISYVGFGSQKVNPDFENEMLVTLKTSVIGIDAMGNDISASKTLKISIPPLVIIDGKESTKSVMASIDPKSIEHINVLKDAKAVEKYGDKGKDGVIEITLKTSDNSIANQTLKVQANSPFKFGNADGSGKTPLIIVDGVIAESQNIKNIPPETIKSISVLKDASATSIYGEKGKDGVILIQTKKAEAGNNPTTVNVIGYSKDQKKADVFVIVEEMPEFPGGQTALRSFIAATVQYPAIAMENGIQGKVFVNFVVGKDGNVTDAKIARGVDPSLDNEALRVVNSLPKWKPGKQKGEPVNVSYTVPINFQLPADQAKVEKSVSSNQDKPTFFIVEEMPEFPGGVEALKAFVASSLKYPSFALENGIQGKVFVNFIVGKDGSVTDAKIARGVDPSIDKEALRIVNSLPKWKPGSQAGEAVAVSYTIPINFKLPPETISKEKLRTKSDAVQPETTAKPTIEKTIYKLIIVPNPTKDKATITLEGSDAKSNLEVSVFDMQGNLMKKEMKNGPTFTLNFAGYASGTYLIVARDGTDQFKGQLVVNH